MEFSDEFDELTGESIYLRIREKYPLRWPGYPLLLLWYLSEGEPKANRQDQHPHRNVLL